MSRLYVFALLACTAAATAQQSSQPPPTPKAEQAYFDQQDGLHAKASAIFHDEINRSKSTPCDMNKSNVEFTSCLFSDNLKTNRNYLEFVHTLQASLALRDPAVNAAIHPSGEKPFVAAEAAWRIFRDKTCEVVQNSYAGGTGAGSAVATCKQDLTRQHLKDLASILLPDQK